MKRHVWIRYGMLMGLLLCSWSLEARQGQPWRAYYQGTIGTELEVQVELEVNGTTVSGSYFYPKFGVPLTLAGTLSTTGKLVLEERDAAKKSTGKWQGTFTEAYRQGKGTWTTPDSKKPLNFTLTKVAEYVRTETSQGEKLSVVTSAPYFVESAAAWQQINATLQEHLQMQHQQFLQQTQKALRRAAGTPPAALGLELYYDYKIAYYAPHLVSLLATVQERSVDDHLSTGYASMHFRVQDDKATPLTLMDIFLPDSPYVETLSTYCLSTLRKKIAATAALTSRLQANDFQAFTMTPTGLTFAFSPYQLGIAGAESLFVTVPYPVLANVLKSAGPLGHPNQ